MVYCVLQGDDYLHKDWISA